MTSVIGTAMARAPRNVRTKNPVLVKGKMNEIGDFVVYIERFLESVQSSNVQLQDKDNLRSAVLMLCSNLKVYGAQLELHHKGESV